MYLIADYIDQISFVNLSAWFITALLIVSGYKYLKNVLAFIVMKFYELFIGSQNHFAPY
jgi:uncharacterized membrane protein